MVKKFIAGDEVVRTAGTYGECVIGQTYVVEHGTDLHNNIKLVGLSIGYCSDYFELASSVPKFIGQPGVKPMQLPTDAEVRKGTPITSGVLDYFPLAIAAVAQCSKAGNDQHNPGQPLHWAKEKSSDHADCIARHLIDRGAFDTDNIRHSVKLAWRALALAQLELEAANAVQA